MLQPGLQSADPHESETAALRLHSNPSTADPQCCFARHFHKYLEQGSRMPTRSNSSLKNCGRHMDSQVFDWDAGFPCFPETRSTPDHCRGLKSEVVPSAR